MTIRARFVKEGWRVLLPYGTAVAAAMAISAAFITVLFISLSKIESSLPRFGFFAIREFHIAIRDVTHLRDMISLAQTAPAAQESLELLSEANDLVYIRFERVDGRGTSSEIPAYASIVPQVNDAVMRLDATLAAGLPFDETRLKELGLELERLVERMNDEYYKYGAEVNADLYTAEDSLSKFNYQITIALAVLSLLAIGTAVLLIGRRETGVPRLAGRDDAIEEPRLDVRQQGRNAGSGAACRQAVSAVPDRPRSFQERERYIRPSRRRSAAEGRR
jgi:hypothetical protein